MAENAATKQRGKPFPKGVSGNPSGKPRGCRHKATRVAQSLLDGEADALARKAVEMALGGDTTAMRLCLERICPPVRERAISAEFVLPELTAENLPKAMAIIVQAVAEGNILPGEGEALTAMLGSLGKALELSELERRIAALEGRKEVEK